MSWYESAKQVVENKQAARVSGRLLDLWTASAIVAVFEALKTDAAREKFNALPFERLASICIGLAR